MNECLRSHYYDEDEMHEMHEECGVFGIYDFDGWSTGHCCSKHVGAKV